MAANKTSTETPAADSEKTVKEEATVPHQITPDVETISENEESETFGDKIKGLLKNKKVIAGAASVVTIAAGVIFVKMRGDKVDPEEEISD